MVTLQFSDESGMAPIEVTADTKQHAFEKLNNQLRVMAESEQ